MITKNDCLSILVKLQDSGIQVDSQINALMRSKQIPLQVLQFISANRGIEIANFYEVLRKSYNAKKSPLYKNIVQDSQDIEDILVTLASMQTQIFLYSKKLDGEVAKQAFYKEARAQQLSRVLGAYFNQLNEEPARMLIKLIKSDLMVLQYIAGRRDIA